MRRVFIFILIVLLPGIATIAQKPIDKNEFDKLVDFVSCKYTNVYIQKVGRGNDSIVYQKNIKPKLEKSTLEEHLSTDELYKLLKENSWGQTADNLVKLRKDKKQFSAVSDKSNDEIIRYIVDIGGKYKDYIGDSVINGLTKELLTKYPVAQQAVVKAEETTPQSTVYNQVRPSSNFWLWAVLIASNLLWMALIVFFSKEYIKHVTYRSKRLEEKFKLNSETETTDNQNVKAQLKNLVEKIKNVEDKISEQNDAISRIQQRNFNEFNGNRSDFDSTKQEIEERPFIKYLKSEPGKIFRESQSPEGCFFRLRNERDYTAQFEFCGDEKKAIAQRIFIDEISVIVSGNYAHTHVKTVSMGDLRRNGEKWEVVNPIKIKIE